MLEIDRHLWIAQQPLRFFGVEVGTRMTIIRLEDNSLVLISPIKINSQLQQEINSLGTVKYLVAPNLFHHLYLAPAQQLYPDALIIAPPGLKAKQPNLNLDRVFTRDTIEFAGEIEHTLLTGFQAFVPPKIAAVNEIAFYHLRSKTLIITDSAFNFDRSFPTVTQLVARIIGSYGVLKPSWLEKIAVQNKPELKEAIERVLQWDFKRVIMAHGQIVETDAKQQLAKAYQWLLE